MSGRNFEKKIIATIVLISFAAKLILIFSYKNLLTLGSDDLNYIKSAVVLLKKGTFVFHNYNEPTVFIMPLYPVFLASIFKIFGYDIAGMQAVRIVQAVISCITIILVYLTGKKYFKSEIAIISALLVAFYIPNITTVGYMLTETIFTAILCLLVYWSLKFSHKPGILKFLVLGLVWTAATLCRPTIAFYPLLLFFYAIIHLKMKIRDVVKYGAVMSVVFILVMLPWWTRNYNEYGEFIPLAASSGNPMLQGTYVGYNQTPENIVYYKLGKNAFETNKSEMAVAKQRIKSELMKDRWNYVKWFTLGKTYYLWCSAFYWKEFFGIGRNIVFAYHYIILLGFAGIAVLVRRNFFRYVLPVSIILYFNAVHCVYMAFDRYAFPLLPFLSIFSAYLIYNIFYLCKSAVLLVCKNV